MTRTYTVTKNDITTVHEMSPEMEIVFKKAKEYDEKGIWCKCENPITGAIIPRGHSVDVECANCGGWIQIG